MTRTFTNDNSRWFEPRRRARSDELKTIISEAHAQLPKLQRQREERELKVEAVLADLLHAHLTGIVALRFHRNLKDYKGHNPYRLPHVETKGILDVLRELQQARIIEITPGKRGDGVSRVKVGAWLKEKLEAGNWRWTLGDVCKDQDSGQTIVLKDEKCPSEADCEQQRKRAPLKLYRDTPAISKMRARIEEINRWIGGLDVALAATGIDPAALAWDPTDRRLYRVFTHGRVELDRGGRFYGGFWIGMPKKERWRIAINKVGLVQLDFNAMFVRLLYARAKAKLSKGDDPYTWPEAEASGLSRGAVKKLLSARMFDEGPRRTYPRRDPDDPPNLFPSSRKLPVTQALQCIETRHAKIAHLLGTGIGHELFFDESEIMLEALEQCMEAGIPALPIHDALLVPQEKYQQAGDILAEAFRARTKLLGLESEPRIVATKPLWPSLAAALRRLEEGGIMKDVPGVPDLCPDLVWRRVREGNWTDERPMVFWGPNDPRRHDPSKREFLKGNRLAAANKFHAAYESTKECLMAFEKTRCPPTTWIGRWLIATLYIEPVLVASAEHRGPLVGKRRHKPEEQGRLDLREGIRAIVARLTDEHFAQLEAFLAALYLPTIPVPPLGCSAKCDYSNIVTNYQWLNMWIVKI